MNEPAAAPAVSVIMPVYNAARHLEAAVRSVLAQTRGDFELFIVDDGSTDESPAIARRLAEERPDGIEVLRHADGGNHGVAAARNLAAGRARGRYLAFLDADDQWLPGKLEAQVAWMESHPDVGLSFTRSRILREGRGEKFIPGVDELGDAPPSDHKQAVVQIILVHVNYIFSTVMVRRECFAAVHGFPEQLPFQSEDRIMVAKVAADFGVGLVNEVLCEYFAHDASYSTGVVSDGTAPVIFFDMQVRVVKWLATENGKPGWARDIAGAVLPIYFVAALLCKRDRQLVGNVLRNLREVLRMFPDLLPLFLWKSFIHTRVAVCFRRLWYGLRLKTRPRDTEQTSDS